MPLIRDRSFNSTDTGLHHCPEPHCACALLNLQDLLVHMNVAHGKGRSGMVQPTAPSFRCWETVCGFTTTSQGALTRHYRERHGIEPPYLQAPARSASKSTSLGRGPPPNRGNSASRRRNGTPHFASVYPSTPNSSSSSYDTAAISATFKRNMSHAYATVLARSAASSPVSSPRLAPALALPSLSPTARTQSHHYNREPSPGPAPWTNRSLCPNPGPHLCNCPGSPVEMSSSAHELELEDPERQWVGWRDDSDTGTLAEDCINIATGDRPFCHRAFPMNGVEFLPAEMHGMRDGDRVWG
ncbi:hypothetical protein C8F01DRAFT_1230524 [Mycena amicta]|nr:hypothetical protein C8F01DRAFT_1230524 [Mycena amicta]